MGACVSTEGPGAPLPPDSGVLGRSGSGGGGKDGKKKKRSSKSSRGSRGSKGKRRSSKGSKGRRRSSSNKSNRGPSTATPPKTREPSNSLPSYAAAIKGGAAPPAPGGMAGSSKKFAHKSLHLPAPHMETDDHNQGWKPDVLLVTTADHEFAAVLRLMTPPPKREAIVKFTLDHDPNSTLDDTTYYIGYFGTYLAVLVQTAQGAQGPQGSQSVCARAIAEFNPKCVVAVGFCFGCRPSSGQRLGDILVSSKIACYDLKRVDATGSTFRGPKPDVDAKFLKAWSAEANTEFEFVNEADNTKCQVNSGLMLSGSVLMDHGDEALELLKEFPESIGGEMEGFGIYTSSTTASIPWVMVKAICDFGGLDGDKEKSSQPFAAAAAASYARTVLQKPWLEKFKRPRRAAAYTDNLPPVPANFTGREDVMKALEKSLYGSGPAAIAPKAMTGLGGIGKSTTAKMYGHRSRARNKYPALIWWINAETKAELDTDMASLAKALNLDPVRKQPETVVREVKDALRPLKGWLLIFDNAPNPDDIEEYVPNQDPNRTQHVLITSRSSNWDSVVPVGKLNDEDCVRLLYRLTTKNSKDISTISPQFRKDALELAKELGNLPLALTQAGTYCAKLRLSISGYLKAFRKQPSKVLGKGGPADYDKQTVLNTWKVSMEKVAEVSSLASTILEKVSFLAPDAIPHELFGEYAADELDYLEAMSVLGEYSLVTIDNEANVFSIHRLVQQVVREDLAHQDGADRTNEVLERVIVDLRNAWRFDYKDPKTWPACGRLFNHVAAAADFAQPASIRLNAVINLLGSNGIGGYEQDCKGNYPAAAKLYTRAIELSTQVNGPEANLTAVLKNDTGLLYKTMGDYDKAEVLYRETLAIRKAQGENTSSYASSLNNLASLLETTGKYSEALDLHMKAIEIKKVLFGEDHPNYGLSCNNLGLLYKTMGKHAEALPWYEKSLAIKEKSFGKHHMEYAIGLNNMAQLYRAQGKTKEAVPLMEDALKIKQDVYGKKHIAVTVNLSNLAIAYQVLGEYHKSHPLLEEAYEIRKSTLSKENPDYAAAAYNLGKSFQIQKKYAEAEPLLLEDIQLTAQRRGWSHSFVVGAVANLHRMYKAMGHKDGQVEKIRKMVPEHAHSKYSML